MSLDVDRLLEVLYPFAVLENGTRLVVAFSGGVDTTVLVHVLHQAAKQLGFSLSALHVDHAIHPESDQWEAHCRQFCGDLGITYHSTRLTEFSQCARVSEDDARVARYTWLEQKLETGDILLTAHHKDDQAETVMLNLMRGSGARGLSGIPVARRFGKALLVRPMLQFTKSQILDYAHEHRLKFIQDPANENLDYDRNYLRHVVIPALLKRWGGAIDNISRSADHLTDCRKMLADLARLDAASCRSEGTSIFGIGYPLSQEGLWVLDRARQINLIRYWIRRHSLTEPRRQGLENFLNTAMSGDAQFAELGWDRYRMYLYQMNLYLAHNIVNTERTFSTDWDLQGPLTLECAGIRLVPMQVTGRGILASQLSDRVRVGFRQGGERFRLPRRSHSSKLKKLLQMDSVPPWERKILPLVYNDSDLVAVVPWSVADGFAATGSQPGIEISVELLAASTR